MQYRCVATSVEGFVQQLAVAYITHGYWFYVVGEIPEGKDPAAVDAKLIARYGISMSKWARCRRKKQGLANMQYLRYARFFVLVATRGRHEFFDRERGMLRDVRRVPIKFADYSVGCRKGRDGRWHPSVRVQGEIYWGARGYFEELACRRGTSELVRELHQAGFVRYAPVQRQLLAIARAINRARRCAGLDSIPTSSLALQRRIVAPFEWRGAPSPRPPMVSPLMVPGPEVNG